MLCPFSHLENLVIDPDDGCGEGGSKQQHRMKGHILQEYTIG